MASMPPVSLKVSRSSLSVVTRALQQVDTQIKAEGTKELTTLGELVEHDAERLASGRVVGVSKQWAEMRTRVSPSAVYVVPVMQSSRIAARKRRTFAPRMLSKAMVPALENRRSETYRRFQALTVRVAKAFNG